MKNRRLRGTIALLSSRIHEIIILGASYDFIDTVWFSRRTDCHHFSLPFIPCFSTGIICAMVLLENSRRSKGDDY